MTARQSCNSRRNLEPCQPSAAKGGTSKISQGVSGHPEAGNQMTGGQVIGNQAMGIQAMGDHATGNHKNGSQNINKVSAPVRATPR
ncbi:hypothetical protein [Sediminicoccus sp. KRV36]|uniref:hypothetical protein n=1 Tax=Sediminicoccus sp. KRV36 TaxID=3133721 RepID=UPI00200D51D7|nr:hypothetical protein [Sediminicoccus rosea]UPY37457.1 hypothetical protein LHU95_01850 [Sediminicoccus rosea]